MGCLKLATNVAAIPELLEPILPDFIMPANNVAAIRKKLLAFLEGTLIAPEHTMLIDYVKQRYAKQVISQQMMDLVTKLAVKQDYL